MADFKDSEEPHSDDSASIFKEESAEDESFLQPSRVKRKRIDSDSDNDNPEDKRSPLIDEEAKKARTAAAALSVVELGQRARLRLEEIGSKRREIVVLEDVPNNLPVPKTTRTPAAPAPAPTVATAAEEPPSSSVVRLEGLPLECTPETIRRFFSGLNPKRIGILPSLFDATLVEWSSEDESNNRLLVEFDSPLVARAACNRSLEPLIIKQQKDEKKSNIVTVTSVAQGDYLLSNLAILATNTAGSEYLCDTRNRVESKLDDAVFNLLWMLAIRKLKLTTTTTGTELKSYPWWTSHDDAASNSKGRLQVQEYYHALHEEMDRLLQDSSSQLLSIQEMDPSIVETDSAVRLNMICHRNLKRLVRRAERLIRIARYENHRKATNDRVD